MAVGGGRGGRGGSLLSFLCFSCSRLCGAQLSWQRRRRRGVCTCGCGGVWTSRCSWRLCGRRGSRRSRGRSRRPPRWAARLRLNPAGCRDDICPCLSGDDICPCLPRSSCSVTRSVGNRPWPPAAGRPPALSHRRTVAVLVGAVKRRWPAGRVGIEVACSFLFQSVAVCFSFLFFLVISCRQPRGRTTRRESEHPYSSSPQWDGGYLEKQPHSAPLRAGLNRSP